jgi:hypothetical protein
VTPHDRDPDHDPDRDHDPDPDHDRDHDRDPDRDHDPDPDHDHDPDRDHDRDPDRDPDRFWRRPRIMAYLTNPKLSTAESITWSCPGRFCASCQSGVSNGPVSYTIWGRSSVTNPSPIATRSPA